MPKLDIDMFDESPKVGDKVKVMGKVTSINDEDGEVEVSYDDVSIVAKDKKRKKRDYDRDFDDVEDDTVMLNMETQPQSQSLDQALAQSFPNTQ